MKLLRRAPKRYLVTAAILLILIIIVILLAFVVPIQSKRGIYLTRTDPKITGCTTVDMKKTSELPTRHVVRYHLLLGQSGKYEYATSKLPQYVNAACLGGDDTVKLNLYLF